MTLQPTKDNGQLLPSLGGFLIFVIDEQEKVDQCASAINAAGYEDREIFLLYGEDGLNLVKRYQESASYFSDAPYQLFSRDRSVLAQGSYVIAINVGSSKNARALADIVRPLGARSFIHFGLFADTNFA